MKRQLAALLPAALLLAACGGGRDQAGAPPDRRFVSAAPPAETTFADTVTATAADTSPVVIFVVKRNDFTPYLDPVVVLADTLEAPPVGQADDPDRERFIRRWFGRGQAYRLFSGGVEVGRIVAGQPHEPGCTALSADARTEGTSDTFAIALASNDRTRPARPTGLRRATPAESAALARLARLALPDSLRGLVDTLGAAGAWALRAPGPIVVGQFGTAFRAGARELEASVLIVAESAGAGLRTAWAETQAWEYDNRVKREFLEALDILGDSVPELILETLYYESIGYDLLVRGPGGWRFVRGGGGGGC